LSTETEKNKVAVVDYGLGNLFSLERALKRIGTVPQVTSDPQAITDASAVIIPGVGAFGDGMRRLHELGLVEAILDSARQGKPIFGICLGMQLLFDESEEFGRHEGLRLVAGKVVRLLDRHPEGFRVKVPHIGWNELHKGDTTHEWRSTVLENLTDGDATYFVHSYVPIPANDDYTIARTNYGGHWYSIAIVKDNVTGVQFHPEKSGPVGLRILSNFCSNLSD